MNKHRLFLTIISLKVIFGIAFVQAQKLPSKQNVSLRATEQINIDGISSEWKGQYQAYSKNIEAFYTIANDDENLYVVVHATNPRTAEKIIEGGISFQVNKTSKKNGKENVVILFPLMPLPICKNILVSAGISLNGKTITDDQQDLTGAFNDEAKANLRTPIEKANSSLSANLKEIKISGISAVNDTVPNVTDVTPYYRTLPLRRHPFKIISKNNEDDIKAMIQFNVKRELTYELQLPIKYIDGLQSKAGSFSYSIIINGRGEGGRPGNTISYSRPPDQVMLNQDLETPTDVSGEYTLAKKQ